MQILVVVATAAEIGPCVAGFRRVSDRGPRATRYAASGHDVDVLVSGVGMVATAAWCARMLQRERYDLALNFGVCGAFDRALGAGTVVHVVSDRLSELGAEDGEAFLTIQQMQLLGDHEPPFRDGKLVNASPPASVTLSSLPAVHGVTVNTVHGNERSIACVTERFAPQVESMEGAAFMYACAVNDVRFAQVRAVSNVVERRNRSAWKMTEAIENLGAVALRIVGEL